MSGRRLRTAARLTSKPPTPFEREMQGREDGKASAFRGDPYRDRSDRGEAYGEGFAWGFQRVAGDGGLGR